ncbi:hypothetical protein Tco_0041334 [Tanacetum coccineum]
MQGDPQVDLKDTGIFDSGCSRHMTGNKSYLTHYQDYDGGFVAFAGSSKGGRITGKGKVKTVGDEAVHKELGDIMERAATTTSSSETEQDSGSDPRCQETILGM